MGSRSRLAVCSRLLISAWMLAATPFLGQSASITPCSVAQPHPGPAPVLFRVDQKGRSGFIDNTGRIMVPLQYADASEFSEGLAAVRLGRRYGFIDQTGKLLVPALYAQALPFHEGFARVEVGKKWGYLDRNGGMAIPPHFDMA